MSEELDRQDDEEGKRRPEAEAHVRALGKILKRPKPRKEEEKAPQG